MKVSKIVAYMEVTSSMILYACSYLALRYGALGGLDSYSFSACRMFASLIFFWLMKWFYVSTESKVEPVSDWNYVYGLIKWGAAMSLTNYACIVTLQLALLTEPAGKAAFVVGLFVLGVPIIEWSLKGFQKCLPLYIWIASGVSVCGLYLLSGCADISYCFGSGQFVGLFWLLGCVVSWSILIVQTSAATKTHDPTSILLASYTGAFILSLIVALSLHIEEFRYPYTNIVASWVPIVSAGAFGAFGSLFFTLSLKALNPTMAALILAMDSFIAALLGYILLHETMTYVEMLGGLFVFGSTVIAIVMKELNIAKTDDTADSDCDTDIGLLGEFNDCTICNDVEGVERVGRNVGNIGETTPLLT